MVEVRTPEVLPHERRGHRMDGIGAAHTRVTPGTREELKGALTER